MFTTLLIRSAAVSTVLLSCPTFAWTQHELSWFSIDGGGQILPPGAGYHLNGTIGQPDAGLTPMSGNGYELVGGFWAVTLAEPPIPGDYDGDGDVDQSDLGVLLSDYGCVSPPEPDCPGDIDGDGDTDQSDLGVLLANFGG
jgi:hypothetical protein